MGNTAKPRSSRRGRPSIDTFAREIMTLISLLKPGVTYDVASVADALDISCEQAERLLQNLLGITDGWSMCVPLSLSPDGQQIELNGNISYGQHIDLLPIHALALASALNVAGVPAQDPLRIKLDTSAPVANACASDSLDTGELGLLRSCMLAIYYGWPLQFEYMGTNDTQPQLREVQPKWLCPSKLSGMWQLQGFDFDKQAERSFNLTRMKNVRALNNEHEGAQPAALITTPEKNDSASAPARSTASVSTASPVSSTIPASPNSAAQNVEPQEVELIFSNRFVAELFNWNESSREELPDGRLKLKVTYYRGMWLPRRIAACLPEVECNVEEVTALAYEWLKTLKTQTELLNYDPFVPLD